MKSNALLLLLCAGVFSMVFPQRVPVTVQAANRKMSVSAAMENLFERPVKNEDATRMPVVLPKKFQKQSTAVKKNETETFKPGQITIDDTTRVTYVYDDKGLLYITLWEAKQGAIWINSQRQTNTYDHAGNRIETVVHDWINNEWIALYSYQYTYYPNGLVNTEQFAQKAEGGLENLWHYEYKYDANGNTLIFISRNWMDGDWVNVARIVYTYDKNNNQLTGYSDLWIGNEWSVRNRFTNEYDENGNVISELYERFSNGIWSPAMRNTLTYDMLGNMEVVLRETYSNGSWTPVNQHLYTYDLPDRKATGLAQTWNDGGWVNVWRYEINYNDNGDIVTYINEIWQDGGWGEKYMISKVFNANGSVATELEQDFINNAWVNFAKRDYEYDAYGNAFAGRSYLSANGAWVPGKGNLNLSYNEGTDYYSNIGTVITIQYTSLTGNEKPVQGANTFSLEQNFPNPFNPETVIRYTLPVGSTVRLRVFDILGNEVTTLVNGEQQAGLHSVTFNGTGLASGIYLCRLEAGNYVTVKKMSLLK